MEITLWLLFKGVYVSFVNFEIVNYFDAILISFQSRDRSMNHGGGSYVYARN